MKESSISNCDICKCNKGIRSISKAKLPSLSSKTFCSALLKPHQPICWHKKGTEKESPLLKNVWQGIASKKNSPKSSRSSSSHSQWHLSQKVGLHSEDKPFLAFLQHRSSLLLQEYFSCKSNNILLEYRVNRIKFCKSKLRYLNK